MILLKNKNKILKVIGNLDIAIAAIALVILIVLTSSGVFMRYILGQPYTWLEEVQLFCMVWIVFAAGGAAFRTGNHVAIEMVVELFPKKIQKVIEIFVDIVILFVIGYLFMQSIGFIKLFVASGRSTSMIKIPYTLIYGIAPVSYILMIISYFTSKYTKRKTEKEVN
ncbi:MAG: TRAP transporter small permease [Clostridium sp.]|nr:TRAP transporter small permease [Clostridium sp.]